MGLAVVSFHPVLGKQRKDRRDIARCAFGEGAVRGLRGRRAGGAGLGCPRPRGRAEPVLPAGVRWALRRCRDRCQSDAGRKAGGTPRGFPGKDGTRCGRLSGRGR